MNPFMVEVIKRTRVASQSADRFLLLQIDKSRFAFCDCEDILYSVAHSYPRQSFQKPWFNSFSLEQENEQFLFLGIEFRGVWSLNSFIDIFFSGRQLIRFPVAKAIIIPPCHAAARETKSIDTTRLISVLRKTLAGTPRLEQSRDTGETFNVSFQIIPGLHRVAFNCSSFSPETKIPSFNDTFTLKNTDAFLLYQIRIIELTNSELLLTEEDVDLNTHLRDSSIGQLFSDDTEHFLGPIFLLWFKFQEKCHVPIHQLEQNFPINIFIDSILQDDEITISGKYLSDRGRFKLALGMKYEDELLLIFRKKEEVIIAFRKKVMSTKSARDLVDRVSQVCRLVANFLGWRVT